MSNRKHIFLPLFLLFALAALDLFFTRGMGFQGLLNLPDWFYHFRLPRVLAAAIAGIALAVSGLALQTLFRNPLAGPFLTGITPGASLGIALILMAFPAGFGMKYMETLGMSSAGLLGGVSVLLLQLLISRRRSGVFTLLLSGVMLGYLAGAGTEILQTLASAEQVRSFVMWGMGNFDRVAMDQLYLFSIIVLLGCILLFFMRFELDAWLPGELYAANAGIQTRNFRFKTILITGLLAGFTTALCGPIGFVGLAAPHLSRMLLKTGSHGKLLIPTALWGAVFCLLADVIAHNLFENLSLNVNAICAVFGAPVVLWVLLKNNSDR